ncbi:hypothetical protein [Dyella sp.]|jgi:uncharacterized lipoprotein|uniref:hypothetical protein n=1 Tax=Dyella sp. TaxID=1869338 RepID=UPI002D787D9C|nr:hypothetical protein [Dyella sp.]HET6433021.1 hypothetical protein [Dyella sp.]
MKKSSLALAVPALVLSGLMLSGCGMFRSHKAWDSAKQESPLEIPPGLDTPSASEALVIPPAGANQPTADGTTAATMGNAATITDGFVLADAVDVAYQRVGKALEQGQIGQVVARDDAAHSYTVSVVAGAAAAKKRGFFGRMFGGKKDTDTQRATAQQVVIAISPSGQSGSEVRAQGAAGAVAKTVDALKKQLGG